MSTNIDFINETGGTATNRRGYDVRQLQNTFIPYNSDSPEEGGKKIKKHTTIIDPKNSDYYKTVTEYEDGTVMSHLSKWYIGPQDEPFSRTRIRGRDGKWYLLEYRNGFFGWQNSELLEKGKITLDDIKETKDLPLLEKRKLLSRINAPISPRFRVELKYGIYPELLSINVYKQNFDIDYDVLHMFPEKAEKNIQSHRPFYGLTKKEAEKLMQIYIEDIQQNALSVIKRGEDLMKRGQSWINAIKKIKK